jgi:dTDP-4-dehydrorhamnose reductase
VPIATREYPTPARRPAYGVLATDKFERAFGFALPEWREALSECLGSPAVSSEP